MDDPCFRCPLPECDEDDPGCIRLKQPATGPRGSKWQAYLDRVLALEPGQVLLFEPMRADRARVLQRAVGRIDHVRTRTYRQNEMVELEVTKCQV